MTRAERLVAFCHSWSPTLARPWGKALGVRGTNRKEARSSAHASLFVRVFQGAWRSDETARMRFH